MIIISNAYVALNTDRYMLGTIVSKLLITLFIWGHTIRLCMSNMYVRSADESNSDG